MEIPEQAQAKAQEIIDNEGIKFALELIAQLAIGVNSVEQKKLQLEQDSAHFFQSIHDHLENNEKAVYFGDIYEINKSLEIIGKDDGVLWLSEIYRELCDMEFLEFDKIEERRVRAPGEPPLQFKFSFLPAFDAYINNLTGNKIIVADDQVFQLLYKQLVKNGFNGGLSDVITELFHNHIYPVKNTIVITNADEYLNPSQLKSKNGFLYHLDKNLNLKEIPT